MCPNCHGGAVIRARMQNAPELECFTCASCSHRWSLFDCDTRGCPDRAFTCCPKCNKFRCPRHGIDRMGACESCKKRTSNVVKPVKRTNWSRTRELHQ